MPEKIRGDIARQFLALLASQPSQAHFHAAALSAILETCPAQSALLVTQQSKGWTAIATAGIAKRIPESLAAHVADSQNVSLAADWIAWPNPQSNSDSFTGSEILAIQLNHPATSADQDRLEDIGELYFAGCAIAKESINLATGAQRLRTILEIATTWQRHQDIHRLLDDIARAAARLLDCDRASIFLWDKAASQLVGHPALGLEGTPLRIADDVGIVGAVLKSGQPKRWDKSDDPREVNRQVDQSTGYQTHSLLAVPLVDAKQRAMGVFEVINHRSGRFSPADEQALLELSLPAAAALENAQVIQDLTKSRDRLMKAAVDRIQIIGNCPALQSMRDMIQRVAATDLAVLLLGENGTGKEVVARTLHLQSRRKHEAFIAVNCAAIAENLLESELFGHEKGAFTDAVSARPGKFELAHNGTLFLDEIGDMSLNGQTKLLRVLEEKVVVRVGGSTPINTDVRVVAATNQNLVELVRQKRFREDLYFRLNVVTLHLPPLRERGGDCLILADFFLDLFCQKIGRKTIQLATSARNKIIEHRWPGNVRELRNMMERLAYLTNGDMIEAHDLAFVLSPTSNPAPAQSSSSAGSASFNMPLNQSLTDATRDFQIRLIDAHIVAAKNNMSLAAENMGLHRSNLYRKMRQLGMETTEE